MPYNAAALAELNAAFKQAVIDMFPLDYAAMRVWLRHTFAMSTLQNVDAWFGKATFERNYLSARTPNAQKAARIIFAEAYLGRTKTYRPLRCKDFYLSPEGSQLGPDKWLEYFGDNYILQNIDSIEVTSEMLTLCYATESDADSYVQGEFDMDDERFDEFRSGLEEE